VLHLAATTDAEPDDASPGSLSIGPERKTGFLRLPFEKYYITPKNDSRRGISDESNEASGIPHSRFNPEGSPNGLD